MSLSTPSQRRGRDAGLHAAGVEVDTIAVDAEAAARRAAAESGVQVRTVADIEGVSAIAHLFGRIWGRDQGPPMTPELLRAMSKAGSYVSGAFRDGELVGACVAFHDEPAKQSLHSHIAGVAPGPWRHVGFALKLHQRSWALRRGITKIAWTFDPLVARNAFFNIAKLGAEPTEYLSNFYGNMADAINGNDDTDRLLARWRLRDAAVVAACSPVTGRHPDAADTRRAGAVDLLTISSDGEPLRARIAASTLDGAVDFLVGLPTDIAAVRRESPDRAARWRIALRDTIEPLLAEGVRIVGFDRAGAYVLRRDGARPDPDSVHRPRADAPKE